MNILVLGSGGREYAICQSLVKTENNKIYCLGTNANPGIIEMCQGFNMIGDIENILRHIELWKIYYVIIGPEKLLFDGIADILWEHNIPCIGPKQSYARIETDKCFARNIMRNNGLTEYLPKYTIFDSIASLSKLEGTINLYQEYVVKPSGLCGGKGVKLSGEHLHNLKETRDYCCQMLQKGHQILIEEKLVGEEFCLFSFCDGKTLKHMPLVKDFKRLEVNDTGPNTGSMGSITYQNHNLPFLNNVDKQHSECLNEQVMALLNTKTPSQIGYRGILYGSYIKTKYGLKVIEYNARFGDPECINLLYLLETPLSEIFQHIVNQTLDQITIKFKKVNSICKYLVPTGYPDNPIKNVSISLNELSGDDLQKIVYSSIESKDGQLILPGSRALAIINMGDDINQISQQINTIADKISGPLFYRKDIGLTKITYSSCGVDISEGNRAVSLMKESIQSTFNDRVYNNYGDFGGVFDISCLNCDYPLMVSSTDGVGTKTAFVWEHIRDSGLSNLGKDIVNHCINDILVKGAKPLFFLDYLAFHKLNSLNAALIVEGMSEACREAECVLIGGETAEMPGVYYPGHFDIAGTIVGVVDKKNIIQGKYNITSGDKIIALPSNGPHTNGYSLIRKIIELEVPSSELLSFLCQPHTSYLEPITILRDTVPILGLCHVTGGGLIENPPRILDETLGMILHKNTWDIPFGFQYLQEKGGLSDIELYRTFNCGIGMLIVVTESNLQKSLEILKDYSAFYIGDIVMLEKERVQII